MTDSQRWGSFPICENGLTPRALEGVGGAPTTRYGCRRTPRQPPHARPRRAAHPARAAGNLNVELEAKLGQRLTLSGKARFDPSVSYAIVFSPEGNHLERVHELEARLDSKSTAKLQAGGAQLSPDLGKALRTVTATWKTRIPLPDDLDASDVAKSLALVADLGGLTDGLHDEVGDRAQAAWAP